MMPSRSALNPSIYAWKRLVIPPNPELPGDIDSSGPFFLTQSGENICKASIDVAGNPRRRVMLLTTDRVMQAGLRFAERGVMDATFDVSLAWFIHHMSRICINLLFGLTVLCGGKNHMKSKLQLNNLT